MVIISSATSRHGWDDLWCVEMDANQIETQTNDITIYMYYYLPAKTPEMIVAINGVLNLSLIVANTLYIIPSLAMA